MLLFSILGSELRATKNTAWCAADFTKKSSSKNNFCTILDTWYTAAVEEISVGWHGSGKGPSEKNGKCAFTLLPASVHLYTVELLSGVILLLTLCDKCWETRFKYYIPSGVLVLQPLMMFPTKCFYSIPPYILHGV